MTTPSPEDIARYAVHASVHPFGVVDDDGNLMAVKRSNGQWHILTYRTVAGAENAAKKHGGTAIERHEA